MIFHFKEPIRELDAWYVRVLKKCQVDSTSLAKTATLASISGGKRTQVRKVWNKDYYAINQKSNASANEVLVHTLHSLDCTGKAYSTISRMNKGECRTRMLLLPCGNDVSSWRDVSNHEFVTYNPIVQSLLNQQMLDQSRKGVYGILYQNTFRICTPNPTLKMVDMRKLKTGKLCASWGLEELKVLLARLEVNVPPHVNCIDEEEARTTPEVYIRRHHSRIYDLSIKELNRDQLVLLAKWASIPKIRVTDLCHIVKKKLLSTNRLINFAIKME